MHPLTVAIVQPHISIISPPKIYLFKPRKCSVQVLEDVLPGDDGKHCDCEVIPGSSFHRGLNPMWLEDQEAEEMGAPLVASCDLWREDSESPWGQKQWMATEAFCSEDWDGEEAGERKMSLSTMQKLMEARVDPRFREAYRKNFAESGAMKGWTKRAFLNYFAGPPAGKHAKMTEELIRSVHMFSEELIIVVNFGMTSSVKLTPKRFPRLILLHGRPMHTDLKRSFNFNKLRAFLFSRALAGVGLDSDQFVAPGVDRLFEMTEREITDAWHRLALPGTSRCFLSLIFLGCTAFTTLLVFTCFYNVETLAMAAWENMGGVVLNLFIESCF